jgi:hypothetical protein
MISIPQAKYNSLLLEMLIHIQTEIQVLRNFVISEYIEKSGRPEDEIRAEYNEMYADAKNAILAQIKTHYDDDFNVDEFLSQFR